LESAYSHERQGFDDPQSLAAYLHTVFDDLVPETDERDAAHRAGPSLST
jgi:hypothetical protein